MAESLSPDQARKLILHSQQLPPAKASGSAIANTLNALEQLAYIQIDTISVIERAHHHTLWNRVPAYKPEHLEQLVEQKQVFEYWWHAAAYLPMRDYRFSLHRKHALATGKLDHWYPRDQKLMRYVYDRIRSEGPLMAKDFEHTGPKTSDWHSKPAKQALEYLYMQGDLMTPYRQNFHKVYDLTERTLPADINDTPPSPDEYARFLIRRFLSAHGVGLPAEFSYLLKNTKPLITQALKHMLEDGELQTINITGVDYYVLPESLNLLDKPLSRSKLKILSPFDNLLIQRKRMQALFDFDYQIECYVPAAKRKFGYFVLPILWDGRLVARMDCKADRKTQILHIHNLALEPWLTKKAAFIAAFCKELHHFMAFNGSKQVIFNQVSDASLKPELQANFPD